MFLKSLKYCLSFIVAIWFPTQILGKETHFSQCKIMDSFAISLDNGNSAYFNTFQGFYLKGEELLLKIEVDDRKDYYKVNLLVVDTKRDRHMVDVRWLGYKSGTENNGMWHSEHRVSKTGFNLFESGQNLFVASSILRFRGSDTFLELRPYNDEMMQGTLLQNLDFPVTTSAVQSLVSVLKCKNLSSLDKIIDFTKTALGDG